MALNDINIIKTNGGLGKPLPSADFISGLVVYLKAKPAGVADTFFLLNSLEEAALKNIKNAGDTQVLWYHIAEFFRICPQGRLCLLIKVNDTDNAFDGSFTEALALQRFAEGSLRQIGIYAPLQGLEAAHLANLQTRAEELEANHTPAVFIYAPKVAANGLTTLPDLKQNTHSKVSVLIAQDGGGLGASLVASDTYPTISCIGACLGAIAKAKVSESIAWVEKQNLVTTAYVGKKVLELDIPALGDGTPLSQLLPSQINSLNDKGYIFLRKHVGIAGTYFNDEFSADGQMSDFNTIHSNRTMDKAVRGVRTALLPKLSGPVSIQENGQLDAGFVELIKILAQQPLQEMRQRGECSAYKVIIDPEQNILQEGKLRLSLKIVPVGVANYIEATIGYVLKLNA